MTERPEIINHFTGRHAFLSNLYLSPIDVLGLGVVPTVEHALQALKTVDPLERARILNHHSPVMAMKAGQFVTPRDRWDEKKFDLAHSLLKLKFAKGSELADKLVATGDAILVENNRWHDNLWGDCICDREECKEPGLNWLGFLLQAVRDELNAGEMMLVVRDVEDDEPTKKIKKTTKKRKKVGID